MVQVYGLSCIQINICRHFPILIGLNWALRAIKCQNLDNLANLASTCSYISQVSGYSSIKINIYSLLFSIQPCLNIYSSTDCDIRCQCVQYREHYLASPWIFRQALFLVAWGGRGCGQLETEETTCKSFHNHITEKIIHSINYCGYIFLHGWTLGGFHLCLDGFLKVISGGSYV